MRCLNVSLLVCDLGSDVKSHFISPITMVIVCSVVNFILFMPSIFVNGFPLVSYFLA